MNLYELIKTNEFRGFPLSLIRKYTLPIVLSNDRFARQMLRCLLFLRKQRVVHCDLKPENILLVHPLKSEIKVIDFGSSCFETEKGIISSDRTNSSVHLYPVSFLSFAGSHSRDDLWYGH
jgi:dual specificity tyrosine-phosphorylation-regulated kinase 2/3/4